MAGTEKTIRPTAHTVTHAIQQQPPIDRPADRPPVYSENPPTYWDAVNADSSHGEGTPSPPLNLYGAIPDEDVSSEMALDPTERPPSYASLFGEIQAARQRSETVSAFVKNMMVLLLGTIGCTFFVGLVLAIPVSMIVMGAMNFHKCPVQNMIPVYLIVFGVVGVLKNLISLARRIKARYDKDDDDAATASPRETKFDNLVNCFLLAWFIAGNVWIYRIYSPSPEECDVALYQYAFWLTTTIYIVFCVIITCILCAAVCALGTGDPHPNPA